MFQHFVNIYVNILLADIFASHCFVNSTLISWSSKTVDNCKKLSQFTLIFASCDDVVHSGSSTCFSNHRCVGFRFPSEISKNFEVDVVNLSVSEPMIPVHNFVAIAYQYYFPVTTTMPPAMLVAEKDFIGCSKFSWLKYSQHL